MKVTFGRMKIVFLIMLIQFLLVVSILFQTLTLGPDEPMEWVDFAAVAAVILIGESLAFFIMFFGKRGAQMGPEILTVRGGMVDYNIPYDEIASAELRDDPFYEGFFPTREIKSPVNLVSPVNRKVKKYIILRRSGNAVTVFNLPSAEETSTFYYELQQRVKK